MLPRVPKFAISSSAFARFAVNSVRTKRAVSLSLIVCMHAYRRNKSIRERKRYMFTGEIEQHIHSGFPVEKHHVDDVRERFSFHVVEKTRDAAFVERRGRGCCFFFSRFVSLSPKKLPLLRRRRIHIVSLVSASDDRESVRNSYSDA